MITCEVTWTQPSPGSVSTFRIFRGSTANNLQLLQEIPNNNNFLYDDRTLAFSTTYFYGVKAHNQNGDSSMSNVINVTTAPPPQPMSITLTWQDNSNNEDGFKVERGTDGVNFSQISQTAANIVTFVDNTVLANTRYYYRVRAFNSAGNSAYTNIANALTAQTIPTAPTSLVAVAG